MSACLPGAIGADFSLFMPSPESQLWRRDFVFGAATSAYQIEGAITADSRLPSIWDTFCATPGKTANGDAGITACDHFHRWREDVALIADIGLDAYRFSIAWPRVMDANGKPNQQGLDFYRQLLELLQEKGIKTYVTLYHWDLPQYLQDRGGWINRDIAYRFADYADLVSRQFRGLVNAWTTLNEPWVAANLGHASGLHAPGLKNLRMARQAMHHLLLAHGNALPVLRANDRETPAGIVIDLGYGKPATDSIADVRAATLFEMQRNAWVLEPLLNRRYPGELDDLWPQTAELVFDGDMDLIAAPIDYLGINYYSRTTVQSDGAHGFLEIPPASGETTQLGWEVFPDGLHNLLTRLRQHYANLPPIYITENGMASADEVRDGEVCDPQRMAYIRRHLDAVDRAMRAGVDVRGYFVWSLLDNFEWSHGFTPRFGIAHVDYTTQRRTLKRSGLAIKAFLAARENAAKS